MMRKLFLATVATVAFAATAQAQTAERVYVGAGLGIIEADEITATGGVLLLGLDATDYFAIEGEAFLSGLATNRFDLAGIPAEVGINGGGAGFVKAQYPLADGFKVHARAGYALFDVDFSIFDAATNAYVGSEETLDGFAWGIGGQFDADDANSVRIDFTFYDFAEADDFGVDAPFQINLAYVRNF